MLPALDFLICDIFSNVSSTLEVVSVSNTAGVVGDADTNEAVKGGSESGSDPSDELFVDVLSKFPSGSVSKETIAMLMVTTDAAGDEPEVETIDVHTEVLRMFNSTRAVMEAAVEERAKVTVREWLKRKASLESCIEVSLREHLELYEKAHAIRLLLEMREQQLKAKARELALSHRRSHFASGFD